MIKPGRMKKYTGFLFFCLFILNTLHAQPGKKKAGKPPTTAEMNAMLKQAQEELNKLGPEQRQLMDSLGIKMPSPGDLPKVSDRQLAEAHKQEQKSKSSVKPGAPAKKVNLSLLQTQQQVQAYLTGLLASCRKNIDAALIKKTDDLLVSAKDPSALPLLLLMQKDIPAAVYASIKTAQKKQGNALVLNNCGFLLQQAGYPDKAVPLLKYLLQTNKHPTVINNLAQSYLSLNENAEAKKLFVMGLAMDPFSSEMHAGMACLLAQEGNKIEASIHIKKSLKESYSETMEELAEQYGIPLSYDDLKRPVPDYFNTNKFKPAAPIASMDQWTTLEAERAAQQERHSNAEAKANELLTKTSKGLDPSVSMQSLPQVAGYFGGTALTRRALRMQQLIMQDQAEFYTEQQTLFNTRSEAAYKELGVAFERTQRASYKNRFDRCDVQIQHLNAYLAKTKEYADAYIRMALPKVYEWSNALVYWDAFLTKGDAYKAMVAGKVSAFFNQISSLSELQKLYPTPEWIFKDCRNNKEEKEKFKLEEMLADPNCPVSLKFNFEVASFKFNCDGMEIEGGEGVKMGLQIDARKGEFTVAFGMGWDEDMLLVQAGAKAMVYFKFDKDFNPMDFGVKGEAGAEMNIGPISAEEKITAAVGISSVNIDAVHQGKEINIFNVDATKD
jgi:Tfp pilus assembly protein PilF